VGRSVGVEWVCGADGASSCVLLDLEEGVSDCLFCRLCSLSKRELV
jgi:hypothetical protein